jgi:hypothetical protein
MPFDEAHEYRQRRPPDVELVSVQLDAGRAAAPQNDFCESNEAQPMGDLVRPQVIGTP